MRAKLHVEWWDAVREKTRGKVGGELFERWFAGLSLLGFEDDEVTVGVPNGFVLEWIQAKYLGPLTEVCSDVADRDVNVKLRVDPELFRRCRENQREVFRSPGAPREKGAAAGDPVRRGPANRAALKGETAEQRGGRSELTIESFVLGPCNQLACSAALEILADPGEVYNPFFVYGPPGVGKTHLLQAIYHAMRRGGPCRPRKRRARNSPGSFPSRLLREVKVPGDLNVRYVTGERFFNHFVASVQDGSLRKFHECYRSLDVLIVDDIQVLVSKKKTQLEFLHTFNSLVDARKQVIVASDTAPKELEGMDGSLIGRFLSGLVTTIKKPDYETRLDIVGYHAQRLRGRLDSKVLEFVAESVRGSARDLIGVLMQLDVHSRVSGRLLGEDAARAVLAERLRIQRRRITLKKIHEEVARHYQLPKEILVSSNRQRCVSRARQLAMYLSRRYTRKSYAEIGKYFGKRNHATVKSGVSKITELLQSSQSTVSQDMQVIAEILEGGRTPGD